MKPIITKRLKELRTERSLTQKDIANILNIQPTAYNNYEKGIRNIDVDSLLILAEYYKVSMDYITGRYETTNNYNPKPVNIINNYNIK